MATKFITVSIDIMHDTNLNQSQKFMLAEIEQLCSLESGCFASNNHFAELIGITKENVSRNLNHLKEMGYIDIKIENGSRNHTRIVTLTNLVIPPYQNSKTPLLKQQETKENIQTNKTNNKHSLVDDYALEDEALTDQGKQILQKFVDYRKKIKEPIKTTAPLKAFIKVMREAVKSGYTPDSIFELMESKEWQTVKMEWIVKEIVKAKEWAE